MSKTKEVIVSVAEVRSGLSSKLKIADLERAVLAEVKAQFIAGGITFYDKEGLYPIPHCKVTSEKSAGELQVITIKQWQ